jgi:hypothetical protein
VSLFTPPGQEDRVGTIVPFSLRADDVEGTYETLKARGVEFLAPPKKEPWGTSVTFKDSEGNSLHFGSAFRLRRGSSRRKRLGPSDRSGRLQPMTPALIGPS